jgi:hypothetical protein
MRNHAFKHGESKNLFVSDTVTIFSVYYKNGQRLTNLQRRKEITFCLRFLLLSFIEKMHLMLSKRPLNLV